MAFVSVYLLAWTIAEKGNTTTLKTTGQLKYDWRYVFCWLVCICYIVRKAPGHFNESKFITWSVYNGMILGSFLLIITHLLGHSYGPDLLYLLGGLQIQAFVTITITLIFVPKLLALYRKEDIKTTNDTFSTTNREYTRTSHIQGEHRREVGVQTDDSYQ